MAIEIVWFLLDARLIQTVEEIDFACVVVDF
jgi:hypothetical protein